MSIVSSGGEAGAFWRDCCGVFGVQAPGHDVSRLTYFGLYALQHRGQESAGIAVTDGQDINFHKGMGLAWLVFSEDDLASLQGNGALGHVRYSTTGSSTVANAQPIVVNSPSGPLAVAHNGNIVNAYELRQQLESEGVVFTSTSDTEVMAHLIARNLKGDILAAVEAMMQKVRGAYSLGILHRGFLLAVRDPWGVRPLCLGRLPANGAHVIASESCALSVVGANFWREVEPGEVLVLERDQCRSFQAIEADRSAFCLFEYVYLARPDSLLMGKPVHEVRKRMGNLLAQEHPADADVVIPVPMTGIPIAHGYAEASRIPYAEGFIHNRYIHRTFIQPDQRMRDLGVRMKFAPLPHILAGRRVVMVEDSIVRGTSTRQIVRLVRDAGAREVHVRIGSPPIPCSCFYGVDTPDAAKLIASHMSVDEIRRTIGADSLGYLSLANLVRACDLPRRTFCTACFSGEYPIALPPRARLDKAMWEEDA